jgi:hypothetical protein
MALSLENANLVWQRAQTALDSLGANKANREAFRVLKAYLAQEKRNPTLQFVAFADLTGDTVIADVATQVYGIFAKKRATATDAFFKAVDHATTAAGTTFYLCLELAEASEQVALIFPSGLPQASGTTIVSSTTDTGATDSTSGDGPDGFFIIGA